MIAVEDGLDVEVVVAVAVAVAEDEQGTKDGKGAPSGVNAIT